MAEYHVFLRNIQGRVAQMDYIRLEASNRFLTTGWWELTVKTLPEPITWQHRIEIFRNGTLILTGPVIKVERRWSYAETDQIFLAGRCDNHYISSAVAVPVTSGPPYTAQEYDTRTGDAETVVKDFFSYNIGPNAITPRRLPNVTVEYNQHRGFVVTGKARFTPLMDILKDMCFAGGIGCELIGGVFRVYAVNDLTGQVRFSTDLDNIAEFEYVAKVPTRNYLYMGGAGEGTSRMIYEYGDTYSVSAAGRIEEFYDMRWGDTVEELHQQAVSALAEDSQGELNIHTIVAPGVTVGTQPYDNFYLGDTVDVVIDGELLHAQVQEVGILDREDGTHEHATFGSYRSWRKGIDGLKGITALTRRLSRLETTS